MGGKIIKDKLFYFLSYEGNRDHEYAHILQTVPTAAIEGRRHVGVGNADLRSGDRSRQRSRTHSVSRQSDSGARMDPIALKVSNMLPLPNVPGNALTNNYDGSGTYTFGRERADSKINWNPTSKLTSFVRFSLLKFDMYDPPVFGAAGGIDVNPQGGQPGNAHGASYSLTASATYMLKSNLILDGYFAWENDNTAVEPDAIGQNVGQQWGIPGTNGPARYQSGMPWFSVTNYSLFGTAGSQTGGFPYYRDNAQHQEVVNLSWIHGRHEFRFGTELQQQYINNLQPAMPRAPSPSAPDRRNYPGALPEINSTATRRFCWGW